MKLLYPNEHLACKNYVSDFNIGFSYWEMEAGSKFRTSNKYYNYLFFFLEGEASVSYNEYKNRDCHGGEMIFVSQDSDFSIVAVSHFKYLKLSFDNQFTLCDMVALESLRREQSTEGGIKKIEIRPPMQTVLDSVVFYLHHKIQCKHLHVIKQKETFLIMRTFYTKEEMSSFLEPLLHRNLDFKAFILQHYHEVKTVEEMATMCKMSVRSFNRKFNQYFNDSPYSWMLKQKSRHVKTRLADENISFSEIIKEYGFSSPAHFSTYCKKQFGQSPSKYRKMLTTNL